MDRPRPWLRYVNADDLDDTSVKFASMNVENVQGEKLGTVDGFIIDVDTARPYYVVVDSGGWFKSKHYLVPVGHARLDGERGVMLADLTRERIKRFPGFDKDEFEKLSDQELEQFAQSTASAWSVTEIVIVSDVPWSEWQPLYLQPDWWQSNYYRPERAGSAGVTAGAEVPSKREASQHEREPELARDSAKRRRD
jgi:hypothetical protein